MKKSLLIYFLIILIFSVKADSEYDKLISEKVTEEYCTYVIGNITKLIEDAYVYYDFFKNPKQPDGMPKYFSTIDFTNELNNINKTNRTYFEFYRDIENILEKSNDDHLNIYGFRTPKSFKFNEYYYCIPFKYELKENGDEINNPELNIKLINQCNEGYTEQEINNVKKFLGKKITKINGDNPFDYLEKMGLKGFSLHSPQARYIFIMKMIYQMPINLFPFTKEEIKLTIEFEGTDEKLEFDYQLKYKDDIGGDFQEFFFNTAYEIIDEGYDSLYLNENNKNKLEKKVLNENNTNIWDIVDGRGILKCKIDEINKVNVILSTGFFPIDVDDYDETMDKCFTQFYSNNYELVIIYSHNFGGRVESCIPFIQYVFPKITKPFTTAKRTTDFIKKYFFDDDKILDPDTCKTFTEKENPAIGENDTYSDNIIHHKTKYLDYLNIFQQKIVDKTRKKYINNNTKKPTDILIFTDGLSVSCASMSLRKLQLFGLGIVVGYNIRPDLINKMKIDASQSSSSVSYYEYSENVQNLKKLGFYLMLTDKEQFDPNDYKEEVKTPMEFKVYPPDIITDIFTTFSDDKYERFIQKAKSIFEEYNINKTCNKDNKYLFLEDSKCDEILNITHAHGGYTCGSDGLWNESNCIAAYCDIGYILNDNRTECIKDNCESINLKEVEIKDQKEYEIEPNNLYIFKINKNDNNKYSFTSNTDSLFFEYNYANNLILAKNGSIFKGGNKVYVNFYLNITEKVKIKIEKIDNKGGDNEKKEEQNNFPVWAIIIIVVLVIIIIGIVVILFMKRKGIDSDTIEEKTELLK